MNSGLANYDLLLVTLSFVISVLGSFTALQMAVRIPNAASGELFGWLGAAAVAMGGGAIWSMHFIAMLAFKTDMTVRYDLPLTLLSLLVAITVTGVGLWVVGRGSGSLVRLIGGGIFTGLGVAGMHYTGMAAMRMPATISYEPFLFGLSLVIAIVASIVALWLAFNLRGNLQRIGSAVVMAIAVCGMHYTGMAAMKMTPTGESATGLGPAFEPSQLGLGIFAITALLLGGCLLVYRRSQKQQEGFVLEI